MKGSTVKGRSGGRTGRWRRAPGDTSGAIDTRHRWPRTVPAAALRGVELIHLGGGESLPCPDAESLPLDPSAGRLGLGTARLSLPPARVHVLSGATIHPGSRVVTAADGRVIAESVMSSIVGHAPLDDVEMRAAPLDVEGCWAVFRSPLRSLYHTLVDDLPRAGLLIHPALARIGSMRLVHDGPLAQVEAELLAHLGSPRVRLEEVPPGRPIRPERVVIPNFVTRFGAGAVPSWYRRWSDGVVLPRVPDAPRRIHLLASTAPPSDTAGDLAEVLARHDVEALPLDELDPMQLLGVLRDAELVIGSAGQGLAGCLFSRRTHVVELLDRQTLDPAIYYLAASKGLPYDYVPSGPVADGSGTDVDWLDRLLTRLR